MKIACIGSGVYSIGIASLLTDTLTNNIWMWTHDKQCINDIKNQLKTINISSNLEEVITKADIIFILVSSSFFKETLSNIQPYLDKQAIIYIGTKGIFKDELYTDYAKNLLNNEIYFFAGPTLALDIQNKNAVGFTSSNIAPLRKIFPNYVSLDNINNYQLLEFAAVYKNIIAIGSGLIMGLTNSYSTVLCYLNKAFKDFYLDSFSPDILTYGIMGDYFLTGTMTSSRNYQYGQALAQNIATTTSYLTNHTVEGYNLLPTLKDYLQKIDKPLKIVNDLYKIIYEKNSPTLILEYLTQDN